MKKTQIQSVLDFIQSHRGITSLQAIRKFGATRLSGIIYRLRNEFPYWNIKSEWVVVKTRFGKVRVKKYYL